jgi:hypothetical protein
MYARRRRDPCAVLRRGDQAYFKVDEPLQSMHSFVRIVVNA